MQNRIHSLIPGGSHTYSKGDDQFPVNAPSVLKKGQGCHVWDNDSNCFIDYGMGLRSVTIGYGDERVVNAALEGMQNGNNLTRPSNLELEAAEKFVEIIPSAEMVKFAKNGSNVVTGAAKLARAYTGRDLIVRCIDHPFFSFDDWFIGSTEMNRGVPGSERNLTKLFSYNSLESLEKVFDEYQHRIACVILEPVAGVPPEDGFLQGVIDLCKSNGAVSVFDEMITGFRVNLGGAAHHYSCSPDLVTFGKGMANGFSVAALGGKRDIMELGGILHPGERVFLMSTTHGAEMCGLAAFLASMKIYQSEPIIDHFWTIGKQLIEGLNREAGKAGLSEYFCTGGLACNPSYSFAEVPNIAKPNELKTLFMELMVEQKILIPWIALSYAHKQEHIDQTLVAAGKSFSTIAGAIESKSIQDLLKGKVVKPVFRKFN